jgi:Epoxide hydrolase N terminus
MTSGSEPFKIHVSDELLALTRSKLEAARFPDQLTDTEWEDGPPSFEIKRLRDYWLSSYDWREEEKKINEELPQFKLKVPVKGWGEIDLHFVHKRSSRTDATPLLFTHGCHLLHGLVI